MVTGIDVDELILLAGRRVGPFAIDEFVTPLLKRGIALVTAYSEINLSFIGEILPHNLAIFNCPAVIAGTQGNDQPHAIAWDGREAIDPATGEVANIFETFSDICMVTNIYILDRTPTIVWEKRK